MKNTTASKAGILIKSCAVCASGRIRHDFFDNGYPICQCEDCGFIFLNPQPAEPETVQPRTAPGQAAGRLYAALLRDYCGFARGSLLQVCGAGVDFSALKNIDVSQVELDTTSYDAAPFAAPETIFDVCCMFDCLQKARSPEKLLLAIRDSLKPGGTLLLTAPSLNRYSVWRGIQTWTGFAAGNFYFFDEQSLKSLLFKCGFRDIYAAKDHRSGESMAVLAQKHPLRTKPLISIIVPIYNEAATFPRLYAMLKEKQLPGADKEIVIVESSSTDGTHDAVKAIAADTGVKVVFEDSPRGKGHAVRTGFKNASGDFVLIQDGDLEYDLDDYDRLLEPLLAYRRAFVLGSRHSNGWKMRHFTDQPLIAFSLNLGHIFFASLLNLFCGTALKDPFTMYKVFRRDCLYGLSLKANRFDFDWEIVIKLIRKGYVPLELPVSYHARSFAEGKKISFIKDPVFWIIALFRFRFCRLYENAGRHFHP